MKFLSKVLFVLTLTVYLSSCQDNINELKVNSPETDYLVFESMEDYDQAIVESVEMNSSDLEAWTKSKGINSFGVKALSIYEGINSKGLTTKEELIAYVESNSDYLQLIEDDGELYIETKYYKNPDRFIINEDKLVQVENKIHRVFENGRLIADKAEKDYLKSISQNEFDLMANSNDLASKNIEIETFTTESIDMARVGNYGPYQEKTASTKKNRTKSFGEIQSSRSSGNSYYKFLFRVRAYKKSFGIWIHAKRTITGEASYVAQGSGQYGQGSKFFQYFWYRSTIYDYKWEKYRPGVVYNNNSKDAIFVAVGVYGDTPSTEPAQFDLR